jgi:hypothetical protein
MSFDLGKILNDMGGVALLVMLALGGMGVAALAVFVERLWTFGRIRKRSVDFGRRASRYLDSHDYQGLAALARKRETRSRR